MPRLILAGLLGGTLLSLGAGLARAEPAPFPAEPAPPAYEDPPPPPPPPELVAQGLTQRGWDLFFPKCWPPWEPPGAPAPPPGVPVFNYWTDVQYSPCPAPPPPPPGQPYPELPPPPLANPWCGPGDVRNSLCVPGEAFYSRVVPPGYYGPPSWYTEIGVPLFMPP
ncbi:MAG: hypothetical protein KDB56_07920 [Mycobacterium sp.]|nr:hypothetical protein [Mycobacterium sp.]